MGKGGDKTDRFSASLNNMQKKYRSPRYSIVIVIQVSQQQFKEKTKLDLLKKGHYFEEKKRTFHVVLHPNPFKLGGNFFTAPNLAKGIVKFVGQLLCMKDTT